MSNLKALKTVVRTIKNMDEQELVIPSGVGVFLLSREEYEREVWRLNDGRNNESSVKKHLSKRGIVLCDYYD